MGSEVDQVTVPNCELMVKTKGNARKDVLRNLKLTFDNSSEEFKAVSNLYNKLIFNYQPLSLGAYLSGTLYINDVPLKVLGQHVDRAGKARILYVTNKGSLLPVVCEPSLPLAAPLMDASCVAVPESTVKHLGMVKSRFKEPFEGCVDGAFVYATVHDTIVKVYIKAGGDETDASWRHYSQLKKLANVMTEFMVIDMVQSGIEPMEYFNTKVVVVDGHTYNNYNIGTSSGLSDVREALSNDQGKLVASSGVLLHRLKYNLPLMLKRLPAKTKESLQGRRFIQSFFDNLDDFKADPATIIIWGYDTFLKVIDGSRQGELLLNTLKVFNGSKFFSNSDVENGKLFSAQCFDSLEALILQSSGGGSGEGYAYLYDNVKGFSTYTIDIPVRMVVFKVFNEVYYLWLRELNE
jgi:hypothetical protein